MAHLTPELLAFILRWLPPPPAHVLEVGCGDGALTRRLAERGFEALGLDPEAPDEDGFVGFTLEEFRSGAEFHATVAIRSLHHLHDPDRALDNLSALLRPGARLVVFEFAVENVDDGATRWLAERGLPHPVQETQVDEVIPLARLRAGLERHFGLLAAEPAAYLAREAGRDDLASEEEETIRSGAIKPAGMRPVYEKPRLKDSLR